MTEMVDNLRPVLLAHARRLKARGLNREQIASGTFDEYWSHAPGSLMQFGFPQWDEPDANLEMREEFRALADEVLAEG